MKLFACISTYLMFQFLFPDSRGRWSLTRAFRLPRMVEDCRHSIISKPQSDACIKSNAMCKGWTYLELIIFKMFGTKFMMSWREFLC